LSRALAAAGTLGNDHVDLALLDWILAAQWAMGYRDAARETYRRAQQFVTSIRDRDAWINARISLVLMLATMGDFDSALRAIAEELSDDHRRGSAARQLLDSIEEGAGVIPYGHRPRAFIPVDRATAIDLAGRLVQLGRSLELPWYRVSTQVDAAKALARLGAFDRARAVVDAIGPLPLDGFDLRDLRIDVRNEIAVTRAKHGDRAGSEAEFRDAVRIAEGLSDEASPAIRLSSGRSSEPASPRTAALIRIAQAQGEAKDLDGARATMVRLHNDVARAEALTMIPRQVADDPEAARRFAEDPSSGFLAIPVLIDLAATKADSGDDAGARAILQRTLAQARRYLDRAADDVMIPPLALSRDAGHFSGRDRGLSGDALGQSRRANAALQLATIQMRLGDIPAALTTIDAISDRGLRDLVALHLIGEQARANDVAGALERGLGLNEPRERLLALWSIASAVDHLTAPAAPAPGRETLPP
jgi:hypothetical protein